MTKDIESITVTPDIEAEARNGWGLSKRYNLLILERFFLKQCVDYAEHLAEAGIDGYNAETIQTALVGVKTVVNKAAVKRDDELANLTRDLNASRTALRDLLRKYALDQEESKNYDER